MGIGVEDSFASADEVKNAMYKQANPTYHKTDNQIEKFADMLEHPVFTGKKKETKEPITLQKMRILGYTWDQTT